MNHELQQQVNDDARHRAQRVDSFLDILEKSGWKLTPEETLVDFGCGDGGLVHEFRKRGFMAYGCDIEFVEESLTDRLRREKILRPISVSPYHLPFDDSSVDVVISDEVMEHVADYSEALKEIHRILRCGGINLHIFPSRYRPIEPHVFVPLATIFRARWWLWFWALLGIRNVFQGGIPARAAVERNSRYLREHTFYLPRNRLRAAFHQFFPVVLFREDLFLQQSRRARAVLRRFSGLRFVSWLYSTFGSRVVLARKSL